MSFLLPLITTAISGIGGALGNRKQVSTQSQTPQLSSDQQRLLDMMIANFSNASKDPNLTGYQASQTDDINHMAELQKQNIIESLASRGISGNAVNYAANRVDSNRFANITKLRQSIPMIAQQQRLATLGTGTNLFNSIPTANKTVGTTPGNVAAGGLGNAASTLAYFLGQGAFSPDKSSASTPSTSTFNPGTFFTPGR